MTTLNNKTHLYFNLEPNEDVTAESILSSTDLSIDIIFDLLSIDTVNESLFNCIEEINEHMISLGLCMVLVIKGAPSNTKFEPLNIVPTLIEAEDYLQMEQTQRDLGVKL